MPLTVSEAGQRLQTTCLATAVVVKRWAIRKPLSRSQRERAVEPFSARETTLSARKKLINLRNPRYRQITSLCNRITKYWHSQTLPYIETDKRLLQHSRENEFDTMMDTFAHELAEAAGRLQEVRSDLLDEARQHLAELYSENDYPLDLTEEYAVTVDKPTIEPPAYLETINPQEYQRRIEEFQLQLQQSVILAEKAMADELAAMVKHLAERLQDGGDGKPQTFRAGSLGKIREFFNRFKELQVREGSELDEVVAQAQGLLNGRSPADLRNSAELRAEVHAGMVEVQERLSGLITPRARRRLGINVSELALAEA